MQPFELIKTVKVDQFKALGPYSAGKVVSGNANLVFLSGQLGTVPDTGDLISQDAGEQATQAMRNMSVLLKASNSDFDNVVKCIVYLVDMADFAKVNEAYAKFYNTEFPARVCIAVHQLPKNALVEIEAIAVQKQ